MAILLWGADTAAALAKTVLEEVQALRACSVTPTLATVQVGTRADGLAYVQSAGKRCRQLGIEVRSFALLQTVTQEEVLNLMHLLSADASVHGILLLRPLPPHLDENKIRQALSPQKDVDGITDHSLYGVFAGIPQGFTPCTAQACMNILDHYGVNLCGKRATVVGCSLVIGRPVAMLLLRRDATVTLCHINTVDVAAACRNAEIVVAAAGCRDLLGAQSFAPGQIVLDVGISVDAHGKLHGDVQMEAAQHMVQAVTPVPGGVGAVTTTVLAAHVAQAARAAQAHEKTVLPC